jgi:hypothetical protein
MLMLNFRDVVRMAPLVRDLLVTMMMLVMLPMRRRLRRCGCREQDREQQRSENGSHAIPPSNSQWR